VKKARMVSLNSLMNICPNGVWVAEVVALEVLGIASKEELKQRFSEGSLPHVQVEHGSRVKATPPYDDHAFFYIQMKGTIVHWPVVGLQEWLNVCSKLSSSESDDVMDSLDSATLKIIRRTTNTSDEQESLKKLKKVNAIVSKDDLKTSTECNGTDNDGYKYGTTVYVRSRQPSSLPSLPSGYKLKIITRADGKVVRQIVRKRTRLTKSNSDGSAACASEAHTIAVQLEPPLTSLYEERKSV
jgi:hypothetical protein